MSRLLLVNNDERPVPATACWWRKLLTPGASGHLYTIQLHVPDDWEPQDYKPWSYHVDYYDGANDWTWPYQWTQYVKRTTKDIRVERDFYVDEEIYPYTITTKRLTYIDILDVVPPASSYHVGWFKVDRESDSYVG